MLETEQLSDLREDAGMTRFGLLACFLNCLEIGGGIESLKTLGCFSLTIIGDDSS